MGFANNFEEGQLNNFFSTRARAKWKMGGQCLKGVHGFQRNQLCILFEDSYLT